MVLLLQSVSVPSASTAGWLAGLKIDSLDPACVVRKGHFGPRSPPRRPFPCLHVSRSVPPVDRRLSVWLLGLSDLGRGIVSAHHFASLVARPGLDDRGRRC